MPSLWLSSKGGRAWSNVSIIRVLLVLVCGVRVTFRPPLWPWLIDARTYDIYEYIPGISYESTWYTSINVNQVPRVDITTNHKTHMISYFVLQSTKWWTRVGLIIYHTPWSDFEKKKWSMIGLWLMIDCSKWWGCQHLCITLYGGAFSESSRRDGFDVSMSPFFAPFFVHAE